MIKIIAILLISIPIFQYKVYDLLIEKLSVGYAYPIDQLLPLVITIFVAILIVKKNISNDVLKKYVAINTKPVLLIIIVVLVVHGWVIGNYFMGEEPNTILRQVNANDKEVFVQGILRGYHYGIYILSYKLFSINAILYNVVSLILYILTAVTFYVFLNQLLNRKILPALVGTLFFVTTPAYMDMFFWQSNFSGMPIALSAGILSLIFLLTYQKNPKLIYYLLSIMFFISMLKISFTRLHAFIALPLYVCLFPLLLQFKLNLKKTFYLALPFLAIFSSFLLTVFILPDHSFEKGVTVKGTPLNTQGYFEVLSMFVAYLFIPSELADDRYPFIKDLLLKQKIIPVDISLTLIIGVFCILVLVIIGLIGLKHIHQIWGRLFVFSVISIFANLVLSPLFIQGYNDVAAIDQRFSNSGVSNGPGIRYVFVSAMGVAILVGVFASWIFDHKKKYKRKFLILTALLFIYYAYLNISSYIIALKVITTNESEIPNRVFSLVPRDGKPKILYSTNPEINAIDSKIGNWLHAFYKESELHYTNSNKEMKNLIASGNYQKNNFYAFYNNPRTQTFKDVSDMARNEFYDNIELIQIQTTKSENLITSFTETDNPFFPVTLSRGMYTSENIYQRLLSPREITIIIYKSMVQNTFPYVDSFNVQDDKKWRGSPFPMAIWDMLKNKPLIVDIRQLDIPLSVTSLGGQTINKLSSELRIKTASELVMRENSSNEEEIILSDLETINKHYIDSKEILNVFQGSPHFNSLSLIYACAEDADWEKQIKSEETVGGIWFIKEFPLNNNIVDEVSTSITCYGSVLRKIIWVGPPIPSQMDIKVI